MKKRMRKLLAGVLTMACVTGLTGCNDSENDSAKVDFELTEGVYVFDEKEIDVDTSASITDYYIKGNDLYFTYVKYPEYPDEFYSYETDDYEVLGKEEPLEDDDIADNEAGDEAGNEADNKTDDVPKDGVEGNTGDISDDELLGDMDDLFGGEDENNQDDNTTDEPVTDEPADEPVEDMTDIDLQEYAPEIMFCKYNLETCELTKLYSIDYNMQGDDSNIVYYVDDEENKISINVSYYYNEEAEGGAGSEIAVNYTVTDSKGNTVTSEDVKGSFIKEGENIDDIYIDSRGVVAEDGTMYIIVRRNEKAEVVRFNDGKVTGSINVENYLSEIALDNEGTPIVTVINEDGKTEVAVLDFDKGAVGDIIYSPAGEYLTGDVISGKANISFFIKSSTVLSIFDMEKGEKKDILKWIDCGLIGDNVMNVIPCDNGKLLCIYMDDSGSYKVGYLVKQEGEQTEKKVLTVASLYTNYELQQKIIAYNKTNDKYKIEYKTYDDKEDAEKALANDIISGNVPDILDATYLDINNYVAKGVFEDLTPYLEQEEIVNKDYFLDGILDITAVDGKIYYLTKYFALNGFCAKKSELGRYADGWSMQDMIDYYNSKPDGTMLLPYESNSTVAYTFLLNNMSAYVDWNTGEVRLDSEEFKKGLEFCKSFPEPSEEELSVDVHKEVKDGKLILNTTYLSEINELQMQQKIFEDDYVFLGYPSEEKNGLAFRCSGETYAISAVSECKEEAWDFIKEIMLSKDEYMQGLPTSKAEFEKLVKRETTTVEYTEEDGTVIKPKEEIMSYDNYEVTITPAKQEDIDLLTELLKNSSISVFDNGINALIEEDITAYFNNSKSLDETVKILQDKVSKYVNENK